MDWSFLRNPIILAIIAASLTYLYMYWENNKRQDENPKADIEQVSFVTPIVVGVLTLFISYNFLSVEVSVPVNNTLEQSKVPQLGGTKGVNLLDINANHLIKPKMSEGVSDSFGSNTYHLLGKNAIKLPPTDVFIDIAKF